MLLRCILLTWSHFLLQSYALFAFVLLWFIWNVVDSIFLITAKEHFCFSLQLFWQYLWEGAFPSSSSLAPCYIAEPVCAFCGLSLLIQQQKFSFEFQIIKTSLVSFFFPWLHKLLEAVLHLLVKMHFKKKISVFIERRSSCFVNLPFSYIEIKLFSKNKLFCLISVTSERENEIPISCHSWGQRTNDSIRSTLPNLTVMLSASQAALAIFQAVFQVLPVFLFS